jgi:hypothetical protein
MSIDKDVLHDIIKASPEASKLADSGNDSGVLPLIHSALPKESVPDSLYTELGVIGAFSDPTDAHVCLLKLEAMAEANPVFKRIMKWLGPGSKGLDFGNATVRAQLDAICSGGVISSTELASLKSLGEKTVEVSINDISSAWARYRGN